MLVRDAGGRLIVGDDFLRAYYLRPEMRPVEASCANEIGLHQRLMQDPRAPVEAAAIESIADTDARSNYRVLLDFRERLLAAPTLEACYVGLFTHGNAGVPPLFIDQLAQIILRNILDPAVEAQDAVDALELRAAELFFREQKASLLQGAVMLADLETVETHASDRVGATRGAGLGQLIAQARAPFEQGGAPLQAISLDVLDSGNAGLYWSRDERHDFVISMGQGSAVLAAFCRVLERWILHLCGVRVRVQSVPRIEDENWAWHVGLDAQSTALLNDLWRDEEPEPERLERLLALFRLDFAVAGDMRADIAGRPVYLALSMDGEGIVRMKPQNLLTNLPLARAS